MHFLSLIFPPVCNFSQNRQIAQTLILKTSVNILMQSGNKVTNTKPKHMHLFYQVPYFSYICKVQCDFTILLATDSIKNNILKPI